MDTPLPPPPSAASTWQPAVDATKQDHADRCPLAGDPAHEWYYCDLSVPVPEMARRLGLLAPAKPTLAEQAQAAPDSAPRPDLDDTWCACGHKRRGHSVDGLRCYATPCPCMAEGGWRDRDRPDTWGQTRRALSLNPQVTGQDFGEAVARPDWFRHGD